MRISRFLSVTTFVFALNLAAFAMPRPPQGTQSFQLAGKSCYAGTVCIASQADTAKLKELGFARLAFIGSSYHSVCYKAVWPTAAVNVQMPDYMSNLEYDRTGMKSVPSTTATEETESDDSTEDSDTTKTNDDSGSDTE
jgi:hypothetical protein